jgi:hypothetical protein
VISRLDPSILDCSTSDSFLNVSLISSSFCVLSICFCCLTTPRTLLAKLTNFVLLCFSIVSCTIFISGGGGIAKVGFTGGPGGIGGPGGPGGIGGPGLTIGAGGTGGPGGLGGPGSGGGTGGPGLTIGAGGPGGRGGPGGPGGTFLTSLTAGRGTMNFSAVSLFFSSDICFFSTTGKFHNIRSFWIMYLGACSLVLVDLSRLSKTSLRSPWRWMSCTAFPNLRPTENEEVSSLAIVCRYSLVCLMPPTKLAWDRRRSMIPRR